MNRPSTTRAAAAAGAGRAAEERRGRRRGFPGRALLAVAALAAALAGLLYLELRSSWLQAHLLSAWAGGIRYQAEAGQSPTVRFPESGPYDVRLGYTGLPRMVERLRERGFRVEEQARTSERFQRAVGLGLFPIYPEKTRAGLVVLDARGRPLHGSTYPQRAYPTYDSIPPLVRRSLLFIENRELLDERFSYRNPAVEWHRLAGAVASLVVRRVGGEGRVFGASTLATQMEKFRHSPGGLTGSAREKLRQMGSASLRAYLRGPRTLETRRQIVLDYLNSVPLAAIPGYGEVIGLGDGLWAWYGADFGEVNRLIASLSGEGAAENALLAEHAPAAENALLAEHAPAAENAPAAEGGPVSPEAAGAYRQALSLLLAHRRPSFYLAHPEGREALQRLTDAYLRLLQAEGAISPELATAALEAESEVRPRSPEPPRISFVERKAATAMRTHLLELLGVPSLYELDRYDLTARATLDGAVQEAVTERLRRLADPAYVREAGLDAFRLVGEGDPSKVIYSFLLYERTPLGNVVRVQTDNFDGPFDLNQAARLELGSTAKLRALLSYLEVVEELHLELGGRSPEELRSLAREAPSDPLTRWAVETLQRNSEISLADMLEAAMERRYSASPAERFFTGGGSHVFQNFDRAHDAAALTVRDGFRHSVNLVFVRVMRDVVRYHMLRVPGSSARILEDPEDPRRQEYLARFADREGRVFVERFYRKHAGRQPEEMLEQLLGGRRLSPERLAWAFRSVAPEAGPEEFAEFLSGQSPNARFSERALQDLYRRAEPAPFDLADRGYLAGVHPLELWVVAHLLENPDVTREEVVRESAGARQEVYRWLFRSGRRAAQDRRIRIMLEVEAFLEIQRQWKKLGYPFENLVPSYGSAIGSSGDRPGALAELVGILLDDGVRRPVVRVEEFRFAEGTPYETALRREPPRRGRVLSPQVAAVGRAALLDVVEHGTARGARGALRRPDGAPLPIGGKTGTGHNQYKVFGPGGRLLQARTVNRTATFAFHIGDRLFGVVTAHVPGPDAEAYRFTSALPVRILTLLAHDLAPLLEEGGGGTAGEGASVETARRPSGRG